MSQQMVKNILIHGEKVDVGEEITQEQAIEHLKELGMGDFIEGREAVNREGTLMFEQENAEKGIN